MNFVFIIGAPRSGTTWLQALLASHPDVVTGQETHFFSAIKHFLEFYDKRDDWRSVGISVYWPKEKRYELIRNYFLKFIETAVSNNKDKKIFLEKTPEHTMCVPLIKNVFPEAKFIHIIRDARHVVSSLIRVFRKHGKIISPTVASFIWAKFVSLGRYYGHNLLGSQYFELKYEDLRLNTFGLLSSIFSWLSLEYDDKLLDSIIQKCKLEEVKKKGKFESIKVAANEPESFFASGAVGSEYDLNSLSLYRIYEICGPLLKELGYIDQIPKIPLWAKIAYSHKLRNLLRLQPI